ncbi:MAG: VOC family protein [Rhodospirillaceae bacterium]|nr:VOC family protein [Rhodospirillaceae bacterium]
MTIALNHTIVWCRDPAASAAFAADILGLPAPRRFMHFHVVDLANGVSLDYAQSDAHSGVLHYAFLVTEAEFDAIFGRIKARGLQHWADPARKLAGQINTHFGGRGVYFEDPGGHLLEIITAPYGETP